MVNGRTKVGTGVDKYIVRINKVFLDRGAMSERITQLEGLLDSTTAIS